MIKLSCMMMPRKHLSLHDTTSLETTATTHSIPELDSETTARYSEDTSPQRDPAQLKEHFQHLLERFIQLRPTTNPSVHIEELAHFTNKLQPLVMMLQPCSPCRPVVEPLHTVMQRYTCAFCTTK